MYSDIRFKKNVANKVIKNHQYEELLQIFEQVLMTENSIVSNQAYIAETILNNWKVYPSF